MNLILIVSILIRVVALAWSLMLLHRLRDWRMAFLSAMLALMALRQSLTVATAQQADATSFIEQSTEMPGLIVSILAFLAVFFLGRIIIERREKDEALRKSEELLRHSQKMEAIGRLAGGIAHDFNNMLTAILGYSESLTHSLDRGTPDHDAATEIYQAGQRAASLTRQLLAYSRKQTLHPRILDLNEVVSKLRNMLDRVIGDDVDFTIRLDRRAGAIFADSVQIEQVILNLVVNARDAMPHGGTLEIAIEGIEPSTQRARGGPGNPSGPLVCLSVRDSGAGMDEETREHIFDPFFTTKGPGSGTGLGLSTVLGIVEQSGGFVDVQSAPGKGSTFSVYLPKAAVVVETSKAVELEPTATQKPRRQCTILLVDDERSVRTLGADILQSAGHVVLTAECGDEAIEVARSHGGRIDVLVTDLVMPGMTGIELAERVSRDWPQINVVYMSGYLKGPNSTGSGIPPGAALLAKPFAIGDLRDVVEAVAEQAR